ncbi:hypothetical protein O3M35_011719 [Rhynocoris fuscipes]|uniref:Uncharacterized protein n=1 Tax=Rhynocoris fuscipes TaxID=488301 RepID=A0AAW1CZI3_9HEMI
MAKICRSFTLRQRILIFGYLNIASSVVLAIFTSLYAVQLCNQEKQQFRNEEWIALAFLIIGVLIALLAAIYFLVGVYKENQNYITVSVAFVIMTIIIFSSLAILFFLMQDWLLAILMSIIACLYNHSVIFLVLIKVISPT